MKTVVLKSFKSCMNEFVCFFAITCMKKLLCFLKSFRKLFLEFERVTVAERSKVLKKGKSYKIKALISPLTSQEKVTYSTSNKKVATVSKTGKVVAKKKGKVVITVKSGKKNAKVKITVK